MTASQEDRDPVSPPIDVPRLRSWVENGRHVTDRDRWLADTVDALLAETERLREGASQHRAAV
jgi:hypothetical protein